MPRQMQRQAVITDLNIILMSVCKRLASNRLETLYEQCLHRYESVTASRNERSKSPKAYLPVIRSTIFDMYQEKTHVSLDTLQNALEQLPPTHFSCWHWSRSTLRRVVTAEMQFSYGARPSYYKTLKEK